MSITHEQLKEITDRPLLAPGAPYDQVRVNAAAIKHQFRDSKRPDLYITHTSRRP